MLIAAPLAAAPLFPPFLLGSNPTPPKAKDIEGLGLELDPRRRKRTG
jgi:hypothetical protein